MKLIAALPYFGNLEFYNHLIQSDEVIFDIHENFIKQSYRSRTQILAANGVLNLSVPLVKKKGNKTPFNELSLAHYEDWQINHIRSIESAYRSAPFFEYYFDEIADLIKKEYPSLLDLNSTIFQWTLECLDIDVEYSLSDAFIENMDNKSLDIRSKQTPKSKHEVKKTPEYYQVFSEKFNFTPNLSIIDLIMNEGPNTITILKG